MISYQNLSLVVSFASSAVGCCADSIEANDRGFIVVNGDMVPNLASVDSDDTIPPQALLWGAVGESADAQSTMFWCAGSGDSFDWNTAWQSAASLADIVRAKGDPCPAIDAVASSDSWCLDDLQWIVRDILAKLCVGGTLRGARVARDFATETCDVC